MRPIRHARGFTVIEMLVVIAIIAILAGLLLATITTVQKRTKARLAAEDIKGLYLAFERYKDRFGKYPTDTDLIKAPSSDRFSKDGDYGLTHKLIKRLIKHKMFSCETSQMVGNSDSDVLRDPWGNPYGVMKLRNPNTPGDVPDFPNVTYQRSGIYIVSNGGQTPMDKSVGGSGGLSLNYRKNCVYAKDD